MDRHGGIAEAAAGNGAEPEVVLDIEGMTCASCVSKVERALDRVGGEGSAEVNLMTRTATVRGPAGAGGDPEPLVEAVRRAGYDARPRHAVAAGGEEAHAHGVDHGGGGAHAGHDHDTTEAPVWRTVLAVALTVPIVVLTFGLPGRMWSDLLVWALATPVVFVAGWPFFRSALRAARHGATTMDTLIALGAFAAYAMSVAAILTGSEGHYFDTAAVIITFILIGKVLEARARRGAGDASRLLLERAAKRATLLGDDGTEREVPLEEIHPGMRVVVRPGEQVPADGVVEEGSSWIDLSLLTGESAPVDIGPGAEVVGAAVNGNGRIVVRVTEVGERTKLAEIARLLTRAQGSKAPVQATADRVSAVFVPVVMALAAATFLGWFAFTDVGAATALLHATAVLLIACPCALGLATPAAVVAGTGRAAELGVLFKGADVFERARRADVLLLDKTGTVTTGVMRLAEVVPGPGWTSEGVVALAAATERGSEHPIATAIVAGARERRLLLPAASDHTVLPGAGAAALVEGERVEVGRPTGGDQAQADVVARMAADGLTPVVVTVSGEPAGVLAVADEIRPSTPDAVRRLRGEMELDVAMVTGDRRETAGAIAAQAGIDRVVAEVFPADKVAEVQRLRKEGRRVVFAGDGINDAPALAAADVGMAMGGGTDVALAAADVNLLSGSLAGAADALALARRTYRVIGENLFWAFGYNVVMIPLAVAGLLTPMWAAAAMALSSVSVVANALRLRRYGRGRTRGRVRG